jgi:hypothetical protein
VSPFTPTRVAPCRRPILSWVYASLELSPSTPRILKPARTTSVRARSLTRRLGNAAQRTSRPSHRVKPPQNGGIGLASSTDSRPLQDWPAPPLDGAPTPLALGIQASPSP